MTAARRIAIGFGVALLLVSIIGITSLASVTSLSRTTEAVRRSTDMVMSLSELERHMTELESAARTFVITGDIAYEAPFNFATAGTEKVLDDLIENASGDEAQTAIALELRRLARSKNRVSSELMDIRRLQGMEAAAAFVRLGTGKAVMDTIRMRTAEMKQHAVTLQAAERAEAAINARRTELITGGGAALAFLLLTIAGITVAREFAVRRRAETAMRESQAQLSQFLDSLPIGAFVIDAHGRPSFANTTALTMLGAGTIDDLDIVTPGMTIPLWRDGQNTAVDAADDPMRAALRGLAARREGLELRTGETHIPIEISAAPVFDSNGNVAYAIAAFSDITERVRARQALQDATRAAEDSNRAKSDFLARMSHELRTPLNSVIGFANILLKNKGGRLGEQEISYLQRVLDNGKHLLLLINDILDLSKVEAGKVQVEWETVALQPLLQDIVHQLETQARNGVRLAVEMKTGLVPITSDSARLRQILINLVGNALKFTEAGSVVVSVDTVPGTRRPSIIRVSDTGIGIPAERLGSIFEAFEQADRSTARQYGGTGLGLPISRALCELLGYTLTVSSDVGVGTQFCIDLLADVNKARTEETNETADA
ncbi:MAG TPA: ATP-binding protein [Longimicrobiales bacterium]